MSSPVPQGARQRLPRLAQDAMERARLTVVPRRRLPAARVPFIGLVSLMLLTGVVGLLLFNTSLQQASFTTTSLEQQATTLSARQQELQMQLDSLNDPQRVARKAQAMGMVIPRVPAFLTLESGKVLGEPAPATEADRFSIEAPPVVNPYAAPAPPAPTAPTSRLRKQARADSTPAGPGPATTDRPVRHGARAENRAAR